MDQEVGWQVIAMAKPTPISQRDIDEHFLQAVKASCRELGVDRIALTFSPDGSRWVVVIDLDPILVPVGDAPELELLTVEVLARVGRHAGITLEQFGAAEATWHSEPNT